MSLPLVVAGLSLVAPVLDLVGQLQHVPLESAALAASALSAVLLLVSLAQRPRAAWLIAAALASGTSVILRLGGYSEGPAFTLLAVVALGAGGGFNSTAPSGHLADVTSVAGGATRVVADAGAEPAPLPHAG